MQASMIEPRPAAKSAQGIVPSIMPRLPKSVCTKLMTDEAVPAFSRTLFRSISILSADCAALPI